MYSACLAKSSAAVVVVVVPVFLVIFSATRKHWRNKENTSARLRWRTEEEEEDITFNRAFWMMIDYGVRETNFQIKTNKNSLRSLFVL
jgi:hypothetical protein